jgi:hypothetical protein
MTAAFDIYADARPTYFSNNGIITGSSTLTFWLWSVPKVITFGVINTPVAIRGYPSIPTDTACTLGANTVFGSSLTINSGATTHTLTLDTSTNNYSLSATSITTGTRGILNARASAIGCSGNWASSVGTFTQGTSTVTLSGTGSTVTTGTGQSFYDLAVSGTYTAASSINVTNDLEVSGTLTVGEYSNTGTIMGTGTFEISPTVDYSLTLGTVECRLVIGGSNITKLASDTNIGNDVTVTGTLIDDGYMTTFTDDSTLDFSTESYLYNVTVQSGVTVTFMADIPAFRVINSGTYAGGGFVEPMPEFTTVPEENAYVGSVWLYTWDQIYWDTLTVETMPGWMIYETDTHTFKAMPNATGFFEFSISLTWENMTTYQNITILVGPEEPFVSFDFLICFVILMILLTLSIISLANPRLRIVGLFVIFAAAIMAIPIILALDEYYWFAVLFLLASITISVISARTSTKGD